MPPSELERNVRPSILDRLIDREPEVKSDPHVSRFESLNQFRRSIKRDLEFVLNTVRTAEPIPDAFHELKRSLYLFGLPDLNGVALENPQDEARMLRSLEDAISAFEPRLTRVRVTASERLTKKSSTLVFHVDAVLLVDPQPEPFSFDTVLEVAKGSYLVKDGQGA